jgi:hypothetical protein
MKTSTAKKKNMIRDYNVNSKFVPNFDLKGALVSAV